MIILIDDDLLIRKSWEFAAKKSAVSFKAYESVESFLLECDKIDKASLVYVDQDLKDGKKGTEESKKIKERGFDQIYLATGYDAESLPKSEHIVKIVGKKPPF